MLEFSLLILLGIVLFFKPEEIKEDIFTQLITRIKSGTEVDLNKFTEELKKQLGQVVDEVKERQQRGN